jgi:hypothetical protein
VPPLSAGNHDIGDNIVSGKMAKRQRCAARALVSHFGEERWAFENAGWGFVGLNSQLLGSNGPAAEADHGWLERTLESFSSGPVAPFCISRCSSIILEPDHEDATLPVVHRCRPRTPGSMQEPSRAPGQHRSQAPDPVLLARWHLLFVGAVHRLRKLLPTTLHWGTREVGIHRLSVSADGFDHRIVGADFLPRHENYTQHGAAGD